MEEFFKKIKIKNKINQIYLFFITKIVSNKLYDKNNINYHLKSFIKKWGIKIKNRG